MPYLPTNGLPFIEEDEATGEVAEIYGEFKRDLQTPFVPNVFKAMASSPEMLAFACKFWVMREEYRTLPESLSSMISYTIAEHSNCTYCSANNELSCRTLGVDEVTLDLMINDLPNLTPERLQIIIDFAIKVAKHPQQLVREDFDKLREQGVTEGEIVEIIITAALGVFSDIVADALQVDVDNVVTSALAEMK